MHRHRIDSSIERVKEIIDVKLAINDYCKIKPDSLINSSIVICSLTLENQVTQIVTEKRRKG